VVDTAKNRRPRFPAETDNPSGRVARDDRGNAVWQWKADDDEHPVSLKNVELSLVDDPLPGPGAVKVNRAAARGGYDPYESGLILKKKQREKKRDLRELSRWIAQQKRLDGGDSED
jgi:hypothetical protein